MSYSLHRLAAGSYDVRLDGEIMAALVRSGNGRGTVTRWHAELLADLPSAERPAPFVDVEHRFDTLAAACEWLGARYPK